MGNSIDDSQVTIDISVPLAGGAIQSLEQLSLIERLLNASNSLIHYLTKLLFPLQLSHFYMMPTQFSIMPVFIVLAITGLCVYAWYKKYYLWLIVWLFYVGTLLPVIGLIQVGGQAAADRYVYLPILPFYLIIAYSLSSLFLSYFQAKKYLYVSIIAAFVISILASLHILTQKQVLIWRNDFTLWQHAYFYDQKNYRAAVNIAALYEREGQLDTALYFYQTATLARPDILSSYNRLAEFYVRLGEIDKALETYEIMDQNGLINEKGTVAKTYFNMAMLYLNTEQIDKAVAAAKKTLQRNPQHKDAKAFLRDYAPNEGL